MHRPYIDVAGMIERLHPHFIQSVKFEFRHAGIHRVRSSRALIVFDIADNEIRVRELQLHDCRIGSNF